MRASTINKIRKLQQEQFTETDYVNRLIGSGKYYDELSEAEKQMYNRYMGFDAGFEALNGAYAKVMGLDPSEVRTKLERRPEKPGFEELDRAFEALKCRNFPDLGGDNEPEERSRS